MLVIFYVQFHGRRVAALQSVHRATGLLCGFFLASGAELHHKPALGLGQDRKIAALWHAFFLNIVDEDFVQSFKADGIVLKNFRDVICSLIDAGISKHQQYSLRIAVNQLHLGFKNCHAGAFTANQSASNVEATIFARQQLIEVVA